MKSMSSQFSPLPAAPPAIAASRQPYCLLHGYMNHSLLAEPSSSSRVVQAETGLRTERREERFPHEAVRGGTSASRTTFKGN